MSAQFSISGVKLTGLKPTQGNLLWLQLNLSNDAHIQQVNYLETTHFYCLKLDFCSKLKCTGVATLSREHHLCDGNVALV